MATMSELRPLLRGPPPMFDSASSRVIFKRFLKALKAVLISCAVGVPAGGVDSDMIVSLPLDSMTSSLKMFYAKRTAEPVSPVSSLLGVSLRGY